MIPTPTMIAGGAAAVLLVANVVTFKAWQGAREDVAVCKVATDTAVKANESNDATITTLETKIANMIAARQVEQEQRDLALAARDREISAARDEAAKLRRQLTAAWRVSNECESLGSVDLAHVCPSVVERLRERATRSH